MDRNRLPCSEMLHIDSHIAAKIVNQGLQFIAQRPILPLCSGRQK